MKYRDLQPSFTPNEVSFNNKTPSLFKVKKEAAMAPFLDNSKMDSNFISNVYEKVL